MKVPTRIVALAAFTIGALALTSCTGGGETTGAGGPIDTSGELSGTIQFQTWSLKNEKFTPYFESVIDAFEEEHPEVTVEWLDQPGDGYQEKILSQANANTLPDVLNLPPDIAYPLVAAGKLVNLEEADPDLKAQYNAGAWDSYSQYPGVEGTYGLPWYLSSDASWWNLEQLAPFGVTEESLPTTVDELLTLAQDVAQESDGKVQLLSSIPALDTFTSAGMEVIDEEGEFVFNTDEAAAIIEKFADAYAAGAMPAEALTGDYGGNAEAYIQEKVAFTTGGTGFTTDLAKDAPALLENTVATQRLGIPPLYVQGLNVSAESDNKEAALAFAEFVTNEENQVEFSTLAVGTAPGTAGGGDAVVDNIASSVTDEKQLAAIDTVFTAMEDAKATPFQWTSDMATYMTQQIALAINGEADAKGQLDKIVEYANANRVDQ
ncbi:MULTISPECIES: ABC transporter substrate-binding protein [unclassified Microbacterium]|uniref:ABC transporter substrate-binding protein n=1 Tax=unclassified Microbacterium TaxID=2609290 RepID=UPI0016001989|nr:MULTISPECIES: extracellular solute-binding protein [unclassified Microbacterium]MBT2483794.1 extracellular solute-binding protein [Microbacterium sp. ISL-108]